MMSCGPTRVVLSPVSPRRAPGVGRTRSRVTSGGRRAPFGRRHPLARFLPSGLSPSVLESHQVHRPMASAGSRTTTRRPPGEVASVTAGSELHRPRSTLALSLPVCHAWHAHHCAGSRQISHSPSCLDFRLSPSDSGCTRVACRRANCPHGVRVVSPNHDTLRVQLTLSVIPIVWPGQPAIGHKLVYFGQRSRAKSAMPRRSD
jgi:hypothetical protein